MLTVFTLGLAVGFVAVVAPGPVSVALVDIGASRGRTSGLHAGLGVAGGDGLAATAALALVVAGSSLPDQFVTATRAVSIAVMLVIGIGLLGRPEVGHSAIGRVRNPFATMLAATALTPSVFGTWVAVLSALPFANDSVRLIVFATGAMLSSIGWHTALGGASGSMAALITDRRRAGLTRIGGIGMVVLATWSLL